MTVFIVGLGFGSIIGGSQANSNYFGTNGTTINRDVDYSSASIDFNLFWEVWDKVLAEHVDQPVNELDLLYGAIRGMVSALKDPYSIYFEPETSQEFINEINGSFEGIGAEIGVKDEKLTIIAPLPGSPAEQAGLLAGDTVLGIDGIDTTYLTLDVAVNYIRGEKGTTVTLTVQREGVVELIEIPIIRDTIKIESVEWEVIEEQGKKLAHIEVIQFNGDTTLQFQEAINEITLEQVDGIILDLRNNAGGYLDASIDLASKFIAEGNPVVYERSSSGEEKPYLSSGTSPLRDMNTVVLQNAGSASASEILAGALQDYHKAVIIGTVSFGKGTVQDFHVYEDGSSLKLTVARWLTPKKNLIDEIGIQPDYYVDLTVEERNNDIDSQLDAAKLYFSDRTAFESRYEQFDPAQLEDSAQLESDQSEQSEEEPSSSDNNVNE